MNPSLANTLALIGRILLAWLFIDSGYAKIGGFQGTVGYIASKGLPAAQALAGAALIIELVGAALLVIGWKARWAALALAVFTAVATFFFHNFWAMPEAQQGMQKLMFLKNLAIIGGLLFVVAYGAGRFSVDRR
jgi:putative oxidoreductase